jgi:sugar-specific transcriptional regulator TrmB
MDLHDLKRIGLTEGEIKVYQALLDLGECTKTALAKNSGIAPSNIYDVTNRLQEKGIISKVEKDGVAHFSPANPRHILDFLDRKENEIKNEKEFVNSLLPSLLLKFQEAKEKVNVEVFQGWNGMRTIFEDLIQECEKGENNYVFGASKGESDEQADRFFLNYSLKREKKGIITNIVFNEDLRSRKERIHFFVKSKLCNVRFIQQSTPAEILLYKNKSCILILTKEPLVIRITSQEVAKSFLQYFNVMWSIAKT